MGPGQSVVCGPSEGEGLKVGRRAVTGRALARLGIQYRSAAPYILCVPEAEVWLELRCGVQKISPTRAWKEKKEKKATKTKS